MEADVPSDRPAAEVSTGTTTALNVAAVASRRPPRKSQQRGMTHMCSWGSSEVFTSSAIESWAQRDTMLRHRASHSSSTHSCPCPVLSLAVGILSPSLPMSAHLPYISPRDTYVTQSPACFLCILTCPPTLSPSLSRCPLFCSSSCQIPPPPLFRVLSLEASPLADT